MIENKLVSELIECGVEQVVHCPGGRSAGLLLEFQKKEVEVLTVYDERTAGFFALGLSLKSNKPVVVLTTSGSAVVEIYPALLEAKYQEGAKLILVSGDRPKETRLTGSPQTINQKDLFRENGIKTLEYEKNTEIKNIDFPAHINLCLQDPNPLKGDKKGLFNSLVIVASLREEEKSEVKEALKNYAGHLVLEPLSNLQSHDFPKAQIIKYPDTVLNKLGVRAFSKIFRIGGVPVLKIWREVEFGKVYSWDKYFFSGGVGVKKVPLDFIQELEGGAVKSLDIQKQIESTMTEYPDSEVSLLKSLEKKIPTGSVVCLGNSLPIREWEFVNYERFKNIGQRGVNGIDGSLSYFLGRTQKEKENWIVLGDITTLYNINDFQVLKFFQDKKIRIVIVNNKGGQIFNRVFKKKNLEVINPQGLSFGKLAEFWEIPYCLFNELPNSLPNHCVIELNPNNSESEKFWQKIGEIKV